MTTVIAALFAALFGAAFCFYGYRVFMVMLPIWGFFGGFWLGAAGTALILGTGFLATVTGWVVGFGLGLVGAVFSYLFYLGGVAWVAGSFGAALGAGLMALLGFESGFLPFVVAASSGLMVALLTLILNIQRYVVIAISALGGAKAILLAVLLFLGRVSLADLQATGNAIQPVLQDSLFWSLAWIIIALVGLTVQLRTNRNYTFNKEQFQEAWG
ncbi:MAG TPA: DUF4203 domain-containing protein [Anaerolineae bacterium]|nr:DUF4203 domain-containing protein [Anaerolineae bacterium]HMR65993.1 DUF4203 domain-containing protein [Anaerolineae bacterium]